MRGALLVVLLPAAALAQTGKQVVKPPIAQYWMSVETAAGMSMPGMSSILSGMMGGPGRGGRTMTLQLGSQQSAPAPKADHLVPAGLKMGEALPLVTPQRPKVERSAPSDGTPGGMERPKGRMLIYWGCGDNVRAGQPVVIDFAKVAEGQTPPNMASRRVSAPTPPALGRSRTYGDWPNPEDPKSVPEDGSLRGEHTVKGNYAPEIRFALGETHDFMEKVALSSEGNRFRWKSVPTATGYFATLFGGTGEKEVVFWSSSEVQEMGAMLMDYVPPAEVARLIREKVVLPPATTECVVPGEVVQRAGGAPFLSFIAYGPEANFVQPPRPSDPKIPWEMQWTAKARFKSTAQLMLGASAQGTQAETESQKPEKTEAPAPADPVEQGIKALRGIFGR
ncbi:MAG: hypothetical protein A3G81_29335 [Betaproteobacteria bacterium RIFCSPLOWO2_12_FULL_65_14]|nr:MAG: hypothetical protein A3G81_29335 [Betaproteobacteria bacterium RIFCSPLOWO2_12_FULL_65_14]